MKPHLIKPQKGDKITCFINMEKWSGVFDGFARTPSGYRYARLLMENGKLIKVPRRGGTIIGNFVNL